MQITDQEANRLLVLKLVRRLAPISRTQLVPLTGLPESVISVIVSDLVRRDLLIEERAPAKGRGRPQIKLSLNGNGLLVVGVTLVLDELRVEIVSLAGRILFGKTFQTQEGSALDTLAQVTADAILRTIEESPYSLSELRGVGIGMSAVVDSGSGTVLWLSDYGPGPCDFAALIERRLAMPVYLDSSGNMMTRVANWFAVDETVRDFTLVAVGFGLGFGQYYGGVLQSGDHGINPEFGHVKLVMDGGRPCYCGGHGCLWAYASLGGIMARVCELRGLPLIARPDDWMERFESIVADARAGEEIASAAFAEGGRALGIALANHVNIRDPANILLAGEHPVVKELMEPPFFEALDANTLAPLRGRAAVYFTTTVKRAYSLGPAALVMERICRGPAPANEVYRGEAVRGGRSAQK